MFVPFALVPLALARDPCAMIDRATDPVDGLVAGYVHAFDPDELTTLALQWRKGAWTLQITMVTWGAVATAGKAGDLARFTVSGAEVDLPARSDTPPGAASSKGTPLTRWKIDYDVTTEQFFKLASAPITSISVSIDGHVHGVPLEPKSVTKLQAALVCALQLRSPG